MVAIRRHRRSPVRWTQATIGVPLASIGRAGIRRIVLNVEDEKVTARRIYERLGFQTACTYLDGEYA
jgi:hypothetical protein